MTTLAELRQANLQEQKESARKSAAPAEEGADRSPSAPAAPERSSQADAGGLERMAVTERPSGLAPAVPASVPGPEAANGVAPAGLGEEPEGAAESAPFLERVRGTIGHKVHHPTGVKVTADMAPALFHRAKKYCLDHGNITVRQLFLDLVTEFLAEEGY